MKTVTVGQLRQNPTEMLADVEAGETYRITRHDREIGRIVPAAEVALILPPRKRGRARTADLSRVELSSAGSIDELLDEIRGAW